MFFLYTDDNKVCEITKYPPIKNNKKLFPSNDKRSFLVLPKKRDIG